MHAPIKSRRGRSEYVLWLTPYIIHEMNHRDFLKKKAVLSKSDTYFSAYKIQRIRVNYLVKQAKVNFCQESIDANRCNPKEMWNDNVLNTLSQLKFSKAVGPDNISAKLLKVTSDIIT